MKIRRKGAAIGFSATLLATMFTIIVAPIVSAAVVVTSAGAVPRGGTSTGTATFQFTESAAACFPAGASPGAIRVVITDSASGSTVHFSGTPVVTAPGSLGATAALSTTTVSNDTLTVNFAGSDTINIEQVTISGLKLSADAAAPIGAIQANGSTSTQLACIQAGGTATGTISAGIGAGATSVIVNVTSGSCIFVATGSGVPPAGQLSFATSPELVNLTAASAINTPAPGQQTLTIAPTVNVHNAAELVSQATACAPTGVFGSPGTVANALTQTATNTQVFPGENNQPAGTSTISDVTAGPGTGTLFAGQTLTFSVAAAGVKFSTPFTVDPTAGVNLGGGPGTPVQCSLNVARTSCSVTVTADVAGDDSLFLSGILLDVDSTAVLGTAVHLTVTTAPAVAINITSDTIAFVGRVVIGVAAQPVIFMGFNDQPSGTITITESGAGFFTSGVGGNNAFALCINSGEQFTRAPWAVVTVAGGTPGLQLLNGVVGASQAKGILYTGFLGSSCARWTVFSASTTGPATIEIRGSADDTTPLGPGATNGPRLSVPNVLFPGSTQETINIGTAATACPDPASVVCEGGFKSAVSNAIRAFKNSVTVTAASQPACARGATDCLLGNVVITETQNGQLKAGSVIAGWILPRSTTLRNDVLLKAGITNDLPIVTTNSASGLLAGPVVVICPPAIPLLSFCFFTFTVTQQSFGPTLGSITISNIHAVVAADAVNGPIQMEFSNSGTILGVPAFPGTGQPFDSVVSNGTVGLPALPGSTKTQAASAIGKTNAPAAFSVSTKVVTLQSNSNNIVTIRIRVDPALVGKSVRIQVAHKNSAGVWSSFTNLTTRVIGSDGFAYYYASAHSAQWNSYRGMFPGNANFSASTSQTVQVRWR